MTHSGLDSQLFITIYFEIKNFCFECSNFKTNQSKSSKGFITVEDFATKISHIFSELNLKHPISLFVATGGGIYRKPLTGIVDTFYQEISISESAMVGDAAGRYNEETGFYTD